MWRRSEAETVAVNQVIHAEQRSRDSGGGSSLPLLFFVFVVFFPSRVWIRWEVARGKRGGGRQ